MTADVQSIGVAEWTLAEDSTKRAIERVAANGYSSIEITVRPDTSAAGIRRLVAMTELVVSAITPGYSTERDCAHQSPRLRRAALRHMQASIEWAGELNAPIVIVVPSDRPEAETTVTRADDLLRAADTIAEAAASIPNGGPTLVLEPLNRYETHLIRTLDEAEELRRLVDSPNVALMADVFHMNIEEDSTRASLRRHAPHIRHLHLADNQRREPGSGSMDIDGTLATLAEVRYAGSLVMEFLPAEDPALRAAHEHVTAALERVRRMPPIGQAK
jgi:D-psicose/D-tagatose/L-ribulose 3-epimerase